MIANEWRTTVPSRVSGLVVAAIVAVLWSPATPRACGQMVTGGMGFHGVSSRFYERHGMSFGFGMGRSGRARWVGGIGSPAPFFSRGWGGWSSGGLRTGWSVRHGQWAGRLGCSLFQGSRRSFVSSSAIVTGLPGYPMSIVDTVQVPLVVGVVPVGPGGAFWIGPYGNQWGVPVSVGRYPYRSWSDPWWYGPSSRGWPDRSYPVVQPHETLVDRFRAARRQTARPASSPVRLTPGAVVTSPDVRGLSAAAFRQLGGRSSRR